MNSRAWRSCVVVAGIAAAAFSPAAKPASTAVYVTSQPPAGASGDDVKALDDAARELRDAVAHRRNLRVVDEAASADVNVVVTNREERDAGDGGFGGIKLTPLGEMIIRFHAKLTPHENGAPGGAPDADEVDLKGIGPGYGSRAAKDGAERLAKWISDHQPRRPGKPPATLGARLAYSAAMNGYL